MNTIAIYLEPTLLSNSVYYSLRFDPTLSEYKIVLLNSINEFESLPKGSVVIIRANIAENISKGTQLYDYQKNYRLRFVVIYESQHPAADIITENQMRVHASMLDEQEYFKKAINKACLGEFYVSHNITTKTFNLKKELMDQLDLLTKCERKIMIAMANGYLSSKDIAKEIGSKDKSVNVMKHNIKAKLNITSDHNFMSFYLDIAKYLGDID